MPAIDPLPPPADFLTRAAELHIEFEAGELDQLGRYLALLLDANTRFNLTAITNPEQAWTRHVLDSLTLVPWIVSLEAQRVIDVGSGGGLPGIPLAIVLPQVRFTLLEATAKKANFLREIAGAAHLDLQNVHVINDRAEVIGQDHHNYRETYDLVLARAVGKLPVLLELTVPLAKVGGHVLAMKGEKAADEIAQAKKALHLLHAQVIQVVATSTGNLVIIEKMRKSPRLYPRHPGEPKRVPLD